MSASEDTLHIQKVWPLEYPMYEKEGDYARSDVVLYVCCFLACQHYRRRSTRRFRTLDTQYDSEFPRTLLVATNIVFPLSHFTFRNCSILSCSMQLPIALYQPKGSPLQLTIPCERGSIIQAASWRVWPCRGVSPEILSPRVCSCFLKFSGHIATWGGPQQHPEEVPLIKIRFAFFPRPLRLACMHVFMDRLQPQPQESRNPRA